MKRNRGAANLPLRLALCFKRLCRVKQKNTVRDGKAESAKVDVKYDAFKPGEKRAEALFKFEFEDRRPACQ